MRVENGICHRCWRCGTSKKKEREWRKNNEPSQNQCIHKKDITTLNLYTTAFFNAFNVESDLSLSSLSWLDRPFWRLHQHHRRGTSIYLLFSNGKFKSIIIIAKNLIPSSYLLHIPTQSRAQSKPTRMVAKINLFKILKYCVCTLLNDRSDDNNIAQQINRMKILKCI